MAWPLGASKASVGSAGPLRKQACHASIRQKCLCEVPVSSPPLLPFLTLPADEAWPCTYYPSHEPTGAGASGIAEAGGGWAAWAVASHYRYRARN